GSLPRGKAPLLFIGDSADDAGYLYYDISRLLGDDQVMILPSGYKRTIKYGQTDPPSQIMRTETLNRLYGNNPPSIVVSYPEALAERVASHTTLDTHTLTLRTGSSIDLTDTQKWLRANGFEEQDYVYEPGHFAVRGSILDIFGYSHELPFRIDLFGDDIDSIRTFNVETQLSEQRIDEVAITSNVALQASGGSLLEFIDPSTIIAVRDHRFTVDRIAAIASDTFSQSAVIADEGDRNAMRQVVDADDFRRRFDSFSQIRFSASSQPDPEASASIDFRCTPQGVYHKNFELISESFTRLLADGYRLCILSDSEKQIERLRVIFSDRGDDIAFTPVLHT
ncbi:MAG: transcription-repair coupling factor, partial [Muribaculaceae bacterium]|nr:transcription-repair coupling factor [Muribaculaceae bacterium]